MSYTFQFKLIDRHWGFDCNDIEIQVGEHGDIEGAWVDGEDLSDNGEALKLITMLIGARRLQQMWSEAALNARIDEMKIAKREQELRKEGA